MAQRFLDADSYFAQGYEGQVTQINADFFGFTGAVFGTAVWSK